MWEEMYPYKNPGIPEAGSTGQLAAHVGDMDLDEGAGRHAARLSKLMCGNDRLKEMEERQSSITVRHGSDEHD